MPASTVQPWQLDRAVAVMRDGIAHGEAGPTVMAIADGKEIIRCEAAAPSDDQRPAPDSIFLLASISKPFIGTAIMQWRSRAACSSPIQPHTTCPSSAASGRIR